MIWNMLGEWLALVYSVILYINFRRDNDSHSTRQRVLGWMYVSVIFTIIFTIASSYTTGYYDRVPGLVAQFATLGYFVFLPMPGVFCFFYTVSLLYKKSTQQKYIKRWRAAWIPYTLYLVGLVANLFIGFIYSIDPVVGYTQGAIVSIPYAINAMYFAGIVATAIKNKNTLNGNVYRGLLSGSIIGAIAMLTQYFLPSVILTGSAWFVATLIIHIFMLNEKRSKDRLTSLYNRDIMLFNMEKKAQKKSKFTLFVFSVRNFKAINEKMGLRFGDILLEEIAESFRTLFPEDAVYRYSGDEFAVLLDEVDEKNAKLINVAAAVFARGFYVEGTDVDLDIVYARVDYPEFGKDTRTLISSADYAITTAKKTSHENNYIYDIELCERMSRRNEIINRLKYAIANDGVVVNYQAIYCVATGKFTQAEALMRLKPDGKEPIFPGEFIPLAEESGLIVNLTYLMLEKVCLDFSKMKRDMGDKNLISSISVNIPYVQFLQFGIYEKIISIINKYGLEPGDIKMEITERTLVSDAERVKHVMTKMQKAGFIFELDDFGVEYSNMSLFLKLPVDIMKIDKSLIDTVTVSENNKEFFRCLIQGAKAVGSQIIVEGIEDKEILDFVVGCGCDYIQGYVFTRPLPYAEFVEFTQKSNGKA